MLTYLPFRNADPPVLAALWRSRAGQPGLLQPVSPDLLEQLVFAKLYFDYDGLVLAHDDGRPVGFAHAGFGPSRTKNWISTESGVTCMVLTAPDCSEDEVAEGLLERCEDYLRRRGAKVFYGGGVGPLDPFYVGLYGVSDLPGILASDRVAGRAFAARGYREVDRIVVMRRELSGFELALDRRQLQVSREMIVDVTVDAPTQSWWEACIFGEFELTRFDLRSRRGGPALATATFRGTAPGAAISVGRTAGLVSISVDPGSRRSGLAMFLLSDAFRWFRRQGIEIVEVQTGMDDAPARAIFAKLGFHELDQGGVWKK